MIGNLLTQLGIAGFKALKGDKLKKVESVVKDFFGDNEIDYSKLSPERAVELRKKILDTDVALTNATLSAYKYELRKGGSLLNTYKDEFTLGFCSLVIIMPLITAFYNLDLAKELVIMVTDLFANPFGLLVIAIFLKTHNLGSFVLSFLNRK